MSAQTMADAFAPVLAKYHAEVVAATWGHLAPEKRKTYTGFILFAIPEYDCGNPCIVQAEFDDLDDSPWLYDAMFDFTSVTKDAGIYRFDGTFCNYKFKGRITKIETGVNASE